MKKLFVLFLAFLLVCLLQAQNALLKRTLHKTNYSWNIGTNAIGTTLSGKNLYVLDNYATTVRKINVQTSDLVNAGRDFSHFYNPFFKGSVITSDHAQNFFVSAYTNSIYNEFFGCLYADNAYKYVVQENLNNPVDSINLLSAIGNFSDSNITAFLSGASTTQKDKIAIWSLSNYSFNDEGNPLIINNMRDGRYAFPSNTSWIDKDNLMVFTNGIEPYRIHLPDSSSVMIPTQKPSAGGGTYFKLKGIPYIAIPTPFSFIEPNAANQGKISLYNIVNPLNPSLLANTQVVANRDNPSNYVSIHADVIGNQANIYIWVPNNGLAVYEMQALDYASFLPSESIIYANQAEITLVNDDPNMAMYYTLDGSIPTVSSTFYTSPFKLSSGNNLIRVLSVKNGVLPSLSEKLYTVTPVSDETQKKWLIKDGISNRGGIATDGLTLYKHLPYSPGVAAYSLADSKLKGDINFFYFEEFDAFEGGGIAICDEYVYVSSVAVSGKTHKVKVLRYPKAGGEGILLLDWMPASNPNLLNKTLAYSIDVWREEDGSGYILAHVDGTRQIALWELDTDANIINNNPNILNVKLIGDNQQPIRDKKARISIVDKQHFWLSGYYENDIFSPYQSTPVYCTIIQDEASYSIEGERMLTQGDINPNIGGATEFTLNGNRYGVFATNNLLPDKNREGSTSSFSIIKKFNKNDTATPTGPIVATFPPDGFSGTSSFIESLIVPQDDKVLIYSMSENYASCSYEFNQAKIDDLQEEYQYGRYNLELNLSDIASSVTPDSKSYYHISNTLEPDDSDTDISSDIFDENTILSLDEGLYTLSFYTEKVAELPTNQQVLINVGPYTWKGEKEKNWSSESAWKINHRQANQPQKHDAVRIPNLLDEEPNYPIIVDDVEIASLELDTDACLSISQEKTMIINDDCNNQGFIEVDAGASLQIQGQFINQKGTHGLILKAAPHKPNASLIFNNPTSETVEASVEFYSKAYWDHNDKIGKNEYHWQFFGIPFYQFENLDTYFSGAYIRRYNEAGWGTSHADKDKRLWVQLQNEDKLEALQAYEIVQKNPKKYTLSGMLYQENISLNLTSTPHIPMEQGQYSGQHILSNPYTAAIPVDAIEFDENMDYSVYLYNTGSLDEWSTAASSGSIIGELPGQYTVLPKYTAGCGGIPNEIPSMQSFLLCLNPNTDKESKLFVPYQSVIRNSSPQRTKKSPKAWLRLELYEDEKLVDVLWIINHPIATKGFDNGWDGRKILSDKINKPMFYIEQNKEKLQISAQNNIHHTAISFKAPDTNTVYTIKSFHGDGMSDIYDCIYLEDRLTGEIVDIISDEAVYSFFNTSQISSPRFVLHADIYVNYKEENAHQILLYADGQIISIDNQTMDDYKILIYDILGSRLIEFLAESNSKSNIPHQLIKGNYVVKYIQLDDYKSFSKKITIP